MMRLLSQIRLPWNKIARTLPEYLMQKQRADANSMIVSKALHLVMLYNLSEDSD